MSLQTHFEYHMIEYLAYLAIAAVVVMGYGVMRILGEL